MESLLKTLLIVLLVYWAIRLLWRVLAPFVLRWLGRRMERAVQRAFQENTMQESPGSDHNPYSATSQKKKQSTKEPVGEYIDYEEID